MQSIQPFIEPALAIGGWMSDLELYWLAKRAMECESIVELGSYKGRSTKALADHCRGAVYAIDPWSGPYYKNDNSILLYSDDSIYAQFKKNVPNKNVVTCRGEFKDFIGQLPSVDMIFIDGDHRYEFVKDDINRALTLIKPKGLICGHDYTHKDWPGVKKAVDEIFPKIELIGSIWWTRVS